MTWFYINDIIAVMAEEKTLIEMYTDGACSGNPGAGGYGTILRHTDATGYCHEKELGERGGNCGCRNSCPCFLHKDRNREFCRQRQNC